MQRKQFIQVSATAIGLALIESHYSIPSLSSQIIKNKKPLIGSLQLMTTSPISEMKRFYKEVIGFTVIKETATTLTIQAGETQISFVNVQQDVRPFYHFAFNIPENKINLAFKWQRQRTALVHPNPAGTPDAVVNFAHWNAHSIFFHDPAGNLVEYIARHDLDNKTSGDFSVKDILYASEIAFIVDDVTKEGGSLLSAMKMKEYKAATDGFWPIGDEHGLLLVIRKGREWTARPGQLNKTGIFPTVVGLSDRQMSDWKFPGYPYEISVE